jgi:uncharacterized protein HemX
MKRGVVISLIVAFVAASGFAYYRQQQFESLNREYEEMKKQVAQCKLEFNQMRELYDHAQVEAQVQRTICEEQLKALRK